jgi:hypothetical protein
MEARGILTMNKRYLEQVERMLRILPYARDRLVEEILKTLSEAQREFLVSIKKGDPQWDILGIPGIEYFPALQWKLVNIRKMDKKKHAEMVAKLQTVLAMD